jgi:hypothetical protein
MSLGMIFALPRGFQAGFDRGADRDVLLNDVRWFEIL